MGVYMYLIQSHHKKVVIIFFGGVGEERHKEKENNVTYRLAHGGIAPTGSSWFDQKAAVPVSFISGALTVHCRNLSPC